MLCLPSPRLLVVLLLVTSVGTWEADIDRVATKYNHRLVAGNEIGASDSSDTVTTITAEKQVPEVPFGLTVLNRSSRSVQLSWAVPYVGNSPISRYIIEYKIFKGTWEADIDRVLVPGEQYVAGVLNLRPATTYQLRIVAENEIGASDPSDTVTITTAGEAPSGPPTNVKCEAEDQHTLKISWEHPQRDEWNGEIFGYYVGYKLSASDKPFLYETVNFSEEEGKKHHLQITNLKMYTQYSVVVQAFNKAGAGPMSEEVRQFTAEGIPEQPPQDTTCLTHTSQTIRVSWVSPPLVAANGIIKGYKVIYGPSDSWLDEKTRDTKITQASETILHGLKKYTNYSMEVLAYTSGGDGVHSTPIYCQTEQDVPEAPSAIKALVMSDDSILVSWKPPEQPNGIVVQYTVYIREDSDEAQDDKPTSEKVSSFQMSYGAYGLKKKERYEFWVTASTLIGEGQPSKSVSISPSDIVPAKIASFDDSFMATYMEDVKLPCLAVGNPPPEIVWSVNGQPFQQDERIRQLSEGSLFIKSVARQDAGEYSCSVENSFGNDTVNHQLVVHAPPQYPKVTLTSRITTSISMKLRPHANDTAPIHGYTVHYKPEFGDWETVQVNAQAQTYTLEGLRCGSRYEIFVTAYNGIGTGIASDILNTRTEGSKPVIPAASRLIEVSTNSITLHLGAWSDVECPMLYFVVEVKKKLQTEWNHVSNRVHPGGNFVVLDLDPANWYHLRVTANNNAGSVVAEYEFETLPLSGAPPQYSQVTLTSRTTTSISMKLRPHANDTAPIHGYTVHYKPEFGDWETVQVNAQAQTYTLEGLRCGSRYEIFVTTYNGIGTGIASDILNTLTEGSKPVIPAASRLIEVSTNSITLHLGAWSAVECPMLYFVVEVKKKLQTEWNHVSNRVQPDKNFVVLDLDPANWYHLRVTANNNAGSVVAEYEFETLPLTGAPPQYSQVTLTSRTTTSISMKLRPHANDTAPIHGYTVHYKPEFGDWETVQVNAQAQTYTLEGLRCGSRYEIFVTTYNGVGTGIASDILNTRTKGSKPVIPAASRVIEVSTNSITLNLGAWSDVECPMLYFVVEVKKKLQTEWNHVSNRVQPDKNFVVLDLDPANWYHLRVTAHNNAGFVVAEYEFETLPLNGGV